jgi:hypothetical protein
VLARQFDRVAEEQGMVDDNALFTEHPGEGLGHFSFVLNQQNSHCSHVSPLSLVIHQDCSSIAGVAAQARVHAMWKSILASEPGAVRGYNQLAPGTGNASTKRDRAIGAGRSLLKLFPVRDVRRQL